MFKRVPHTRYNCHADDRLLETCQDWHRHDGRVKYAANIDVQQR
jgi:hypothetical protein